ncbi:exodeoxyribonuclease VII large subunit, partial [Acetobacter oeni]
AAVAALRATEARLGRSRLSPAPLQALCRERQARLTGLGGLLDSVSPQAVLERGYVLVRDAAGEPVTRAKKLPAGARVTLVFADGDRAARIEGRKDTPQGHLDL